MAKRTSLTPRLSVGAYLIKRLREYGVEHVFGIPGDYVLGFYDQLSKSPLTVVGTCKEDGAGFAADAYARIHGMGACCVTYCVGGLSLANAVAGAYAEKSPVVVISGAPGLNERARDPLLHHKIRSFATQQDIFAQLTCCAVAIEDLDTAYRDIDRALSAAWRCKRPVYIELPRDMVERIPEQPLPSTLAHEGSEAGALAEAIAEAAERLARAKRPVILADVEVHRFGLAKELAQLSERSGIPIAATILGKSVIGERHPHYLGVYEGAMGRAEVRQAVESADCLLLLGSLPTDVNLGIFTAKLDPGRTIEAGAERVQISHHRYEQVRLDDFVRGLLQAKLPKRRSPKLPKRIAPDGHARAQALTVTRLYEMIDTRLADNMAVISDVGLCLFGAIDLTMHRGTEFIAPAYYTSMGFAVPASIGVGLADRRLRPIVLVGDGAFQMTGVELSTAVRQGLAPIVILLDNRGYTTERYIKDGPYNDIQGWNYEQMPALLGAGWATVVRSETDFATAWDTAVANRSSFSLLRCCLEPMDSCPALRRLGERMGANLKA